MTTTKSIGIWMNHATAHVMVLAAPIITSVINSQFTHEEKEKSLQKGENLMHHKEQGRQAEYYKRLGEAIKGYDDVLLFGPTDAKVELLNILNTNKAFPKIKIATKPAEKMTEKQEHAFVRNYFAKRRTALL